MNSQDQGIYLYILGVGCLNLQFPDDLFMKKNYVKNKIKQYLQSDNETTKLHTKILKEHIKVKQ